MVKKVLTITLCLLLVTFFGACKKKEEKTIPKVPFQPLPQTPMQQPTPQMPMQPGGPQMPMQPIPQMPKTEAMPTGKTKVVVPDTVKGKWSSVKLIIEDKTTMNSQEYTVNLNSSFTIPDSDLKVYVGEFLPDFKMDNLTLTSVSNEPKNPAVGIRVMERGKQIFPTLGKQWGWLFARMPDVHPLKHPKYNINLKEGVEKKG